MQVLIDLLKRNRFWVLGAVAATLLSNLSQMFYTVCVGDLVNKIESRSFIGLPFLGLLGILIISNAATQFLNQYVGRYAAEKMAHSLRVGYARRLLWKATQDGKSCDTASAMSIAQNEIANAGAYLGNQFFDIAGMLFMGILVSVFLFIQNVFLTIVIIVPTVMILAYSMFSGRVLSDSAAAALEEKEHMNKVAYAACHAFSSIKIFDGEELCKNAYEIKLTEWEKSAKRMGRRYALYNTLSGIMSRVPLLLLLAVGAYMVLDGQMLLGTLIVFLNLQKSLTQAIMNMPSWLAGFKVFTTNLSRVEMM